MLAAGGVFSFFRLERPPRLLRIMFVNLTSGAGVFVLPIRLDTAACLTSVSASE